MPTMEQNNFLGKSTLDSDSPHSRQSYPRESHNNPVSSSLGISPVVPSSSRPAGCSSSTSPVSDISRTVSSSSTNSTPQPKLVDIRIQNLRTRYEAKGFSQKTIDLFISALDTNSSKTMSSNLRQWIYWCEYHSVDPICCPITSICDFFVDMLTRGLAFNTIAGYRTAISEMHDHVNGVPIGSHPDISQALRAIHTTNPPPVPLDEPIDILPSLDYIRELGSNSSMTIRDLSIKTAFLLALVTACRPSDLRRIDLSTLRKTSTSMKFACVLPKEYKIARAHSLSTSKPASKQIYVGRYADEEDLCPYNSLSTLLSRTEEWRSSEAQQRAVFLITRSPHTPAASDTIAGWIKSVVRLSSPESSAKDMRVLSAFFLQESGADLSSILALGNWSSNSVYQKFYQRGIKIMLERNQTSSVILAQAASSNVSLQ